METEEQPNLIQRLKDKISGKEVLAAGGEIGFGTGIDIVTTPLLLSPDPYSKVAYGAINLVGGAGANYVAQQARTEEDLEWYDRDWGEIISSGLLGIIPGMTHKLGKPLTRVFGDINTYQRAVTVGAGTGVTDQFLRQGINERRLPTGSEIATGATGGAIAGPVFKKSFDELGKIFKKYQGKSPQEVNSLLTATEQRGLNYFRKLIAKNKNNPAAVNELSYRMKEWNFKYKQEVLGEYKDFVDYKHYQLVSRNWKNKLSDRIDGQDPFYSSAKRLPQDQLNKLNKFIDNYEKKEIENDDIRRAVDRAFEINPNTAMNDAQTRRRYREIAGFVHLNDVTRPDGTIEEGLLSIARSEGRDITDVYEYLKREQIGNKQLRAAINAYNNFMRSKNIKTAKEELTKLANKGILKGRSVRRWQRLLFHAEKELFVEKGHKQSLFELFLMSTTGGDRLSNVFMEYVQDKSIMDATGQITILPGNRSKRNLGDLPIYTIVKLKGGTRNLRDDFRKTIMPKEFPSESVPEEFEEVAEILYRNTMDKVLQNFNPNSIDYDANISGYSFALTDALFAMVKKADDLGISYEVFEDIYLLKIPRRIGRAKKREIDQAYLDKLNEKIKELKVTLK